MLKWTVNGARQSYLQATAERTGCTSEESAELALPLARRQRLKRKSSELCLQRRKLRWDEKENLMTTTSTPLQANLRYVPNITVTSEANASPLRKLDSLKDLSNIMPENVADSPKRPLLTDNANSSQTSLNVVLPKTPEPPPKSSVPRQYASTLPTFDVEYSPSGLIPGPLLALRGMGVADTYFEKPRYFTQDDLRTCLEKRAAVAQHADNVDKARTESVKKSATAKTKNKHIVTFSQPNAVEEESLLSSSKMGDMTLERMIDAILESTRKERKFPRYAHLRPPPTMSPTYTPAEDPASDLHEFWDTASAQYLPNTAAQVTLQQRFNEREVRSSPSLVERLRLHERNNSISFQLNRQRAVRRKRRLGIIGKSVRSSATKLNPETPAKAKSQPPTPLPAPASPMIESNISPDSGHNSTSDLEDFAEDSGVLPNVAKVELWEGLDGTKRRLNFSQQQLNSNNNQLESDVENLKEDGV